VNNRPPLSESLAGVVPSAGWSNWFTQVFLGLPWTQGLNITEALDFGATGAQSQSALTVTVTGARSGDAVQVNPTTDVSGIVFTGVVTAKDTVTVYAKNFSSGSINPASQIFRIIVLQN